jgi:hypothetical protein
MNTYKEKIILTYRHLIEVHEELLTRIINVGMAGDYAEVNEVFEEGDNFKFDLEMFRKTGDQNLNKLISFFDELEVLMNSLANINGITEEELDDLTK